MPPSRPAHRSVSRRVVGLALGAALGLFTLAGASQAEVLAYYNFGEGTNSALLDLSPTSTAPGISAGDFGTGAGMPSPVTFANHDTTSTPSGPLAWQHQGNTTTGGAWEDNFTDTQNANNYFTFTLTPTESMSISNISFYLSRNSNGIDSWELRSDANGDNFTTTLGSGNGVFQDSGGGTAWTLASHDVTLTDLTAPTTFRIYIWAATGNGSGNGRIDDVSVTGVVPEPGSMALIGIGGLLVTCRRRVA